MEQLHAIPRLERPAYRDSREMNRDRDPCIDGNQAMLESVEKLVVQRTCAVVKGIVSNVSGTVVTFTAPDKSGTWDVGERHGWDQEDKSAATDNKPGKERPGYSKRMWRTVKETPVPLTDILEHMRASSEIDHLSLDVRE